MKQIIKLGFVLAAYASVACVSLALVYNLTAPAIEAAKQAKAGAGMKIVFEQADSFVPAQNFEKDAASAVTVNALHTAQKGGKVIGAVIEAAGATYDKAVMLIGLDLNRTITGIQFLTLTDTPGFGQRAAEPAFTDQFKGLPASKNLEAGTDFDGLSGATITTKGVANIINYAVWAAGDYLAKNHGGQAGTGGAPVVEAAPSVFDFDTALAELFPVEEGAEKPVYTEVPEVAGTQAGSMTVNKVWTVSSGGKIIGAMASVSGQSFNQAQASVLTAVNTERTIIGCRITELNDTPNIGQRALEKDFYEQFTGKSADDAFAVNEGIDALSGATITSAAITEMVKTGAAQASAALSAQGGN
ncbi:FMN-binding protein [Treponema sp. OMZ 840]|uniref:FMN-binding protein n=1 Tax=Treponema sp. OMZ 840 TaxID=244313 RepID=UPI003D8E0656